MSLVRLFVLVLCVALASSALLGEKCSDSTYAPSGFLCCTTTSSCPSDMSCCDSGLYCCKPSYENIQIRKSSANPSVSWA